MRSLLIFLAFMASWSCAPVVAGSDHDRVRDLVAAGERMPLSQILARIEQTYDGRVLEIESDRENGREIYEIELLDARGRVVELEVDAVTGEIVEAEYDD